MNIMEDPDGREFLLLQEQCEFWRQRYNDEELTEEERSHAGDRYLNILDRSISALQKCNKRWDELEGPLPPPDKETVKDVRSKLADLGIEATLDEVREAIEEEEEEN